MLESGNEFKDEMACCAVKHSTPCGVAIGNSALETYAKLLNATQFLFSGNHGMNYKVDAATAEELNKTFLEIVMATDFDEEALEILRKKKNLRIIKSKIQFQTKNLGENRWRNFGSRCR